MKFLVFLLVFFGPQVDGVVISKCEKCVPLKFHGYVHYLPVCAKDDYGNQETRNTVCEAICSAGSANKVSYVQGSCDECELECNKKQPFLPVCTETPEKMLYANKCTAECAGVKNYAKCYIPGPLGAGARKPYPSSAFLYRLVYPMNSWYNFNQLHGKYIINVLG